MDGWKTGSLYCTMLKAGMTKMAIYVHLYNYTFFFGYNKAVYLTCFFFGSQQQHYNGYVVYITGNVCLQGNDKNIFKSGQRLFI